MSTDIEVMRKWLAEEGIEPNTGAIVSCEMGEVAATSTSTAAGSANILAIEARLACCVFVLGFFAVAMSFNAAGCLIVGEKGSRRVLGLGIPVSAF